MALLDEQNSLSSFVCAFSCYLKPPRHCETSRKACFVCVCVCCLCGGTSRHQAFCDQEKDSPFVLGQCHYHKHHIYIKKQNSCLPESLAALVCMIFNRQLELPTRFAHFTEQPNCINTAFFTSKYLSFFRISHLNLLVLSYVCVQMSDQLCGRNNIYIYIYIYIHVHTHAACIHTCILTCKLRHNVYVYRNIRGSGFICAVVLGSQCRHVQVMLRACYFVGCICVYV